ncbi:MAG TPA: rhodanese-like domain-containing protein [Streptosporangiaceae bacterium]
MARTTIDELLAAARSGLRRLAPAEALAAARGGAALVDIRGDSQLARDGTVPGALVIARNVLEWRLDPGSHYRHPQAPGLHDHVIVLCDEGYQSSLAAAILQQLGFAAVTDVEGGFQAWREAGLPVSLPDSPAPAAPRRRCLKRVPACLRARTVLRSRTT